MRRGLKLKWIVAAVALLTIAGWVPPAHAQDPEDLKRGVARISLMDGDVAVRRGDSGDWVAGIINAPLMSDDYVSTGPNSRCEVEFDGANLIRMGGNAQLHLTVLENGHYQMELAHGTINYRVLRPTDANIEVDTPSISIRPSKQGTYRINVNDAGETQVTARVGEVQVFTPRGDQWVGTGQMLMARGSAGDAEFQVVQAGPMDDWDRWNANRDQTMLRSASPQYVGPGVSGTEDLDQAGVWSYDPAYGNVWMPSENPGWAPYQCGQWVWEDWYGWTWVGCEAWGWAPYHYGRWYWRTGFGWAWYPGVVGVRHYWSPAMVGFVGFGGGVGVGIGFGFGFGNIGWVPLAPFEVFHPWWGPGFYGRAGAFSVANVYVGNAFRNARIAGGITAVSVADFRAGRFTAAMHYSGAQVGTAGMVSGRMPISPTAANLRFTGRAVANVPRNFGANTHFFTHQQPGTATQRMSFAQQQRGFQSASAGRMGPSVGGTPPAGSSAMSRGGAAAGTGAGAASSWRRFGDAPAQTPGGARGSVSDRPAQQTGGSGYNGQRQSSTSNPQSVRVAPQMVRERSSAPAYGNSYTAPRQQSAPSYSAPRQQSAPPSAPRSSGSRGGGGHGHR
jgi:hypothetical protein